jgi:hypothetical protein
VNEETGVLEKVSKKTIRSVHLEKGENDAKYDGYFCLITRELACDAPKSIYGRTF